jgi:asparaginyl-tRNA synthetase
MLKTEHISVKNLFADSGHLNQNITAKGWVRTIRNSKNVSFIELNDGTEFRSIQVVVDSSKIEAIALCQSISTGCSVKVSGKLVPSQGKGQSVEIQAETVELYGTADPEKYPLQKKGHSLEFLREIAHLRPRTNTFGSVLRMRHQMAFAIHKYFNDKGFFYLHSPIITGSDAEGAGAMFRVTTLDAANPPRDENGSINFSEDFFGKSTNLTVSGQLEAELGALALSNVYTFGPTFRAENSNTTRHLAEFWMIEPEMAFYDLDDNMNLVEDFLKYLIAYAMEHAQAELEFFNKMYDNELLERLKFVVNHDFKRITYTEAVEILIRADQKFEFPVSWGTDLQSEHERYLVEKHFKVPVILYNYPKDIKAFYMRMNDDGKTVRAMDVLFPGIGEIVGGSQREERLDHLMARVKECHIEENEIWWYLETRKYGTAPHSGFGLGFERLMLFITGMGNIRDVIPFPRTPKNAEF